MPRPKNGLPVWFCFANDAEARALLHVPGKEAAIGCGFQARASIEIYAYVIYREQGDYYDTAKLKAVSALSRTKPIACE